MFGFCNIEFAYGTRRTSYDCGYRAMIIRPVLGNKLFIENTDGKSNQEANSPFLISAVPAILWTECFLGFEFSASAPELK